MAGHAPDLHEPIRTGGGQGRAGYPSCRHSRSGSCTTSSTCLYAECASGSAVLARATTECCRSSTPSAPQTSSASGSGSESPRERGLSRVGITSSGDSPKPSPRGFQPSSMESPAPWSSRSRRASSVRWTGITGPAHSAVRSSHERALGKNDLRCAGSGALGQRRCNPARCRAPAPTGMADRRRGAGARMCRAPPVSGDPGPCSRAVRGRAAALVVRPSLGPCLL